MSKSIATKSRSSLLSPDRSLLKRDQILRSRDRNLLRQGNIY